MKRHFLLSKKMKVILFVCLVAGASLIECSLHFHNRAQLAEAYAECPASFMIETPNHFDYQRGMECSAMSSAYILRHYGEEADGLELYKDYPGKLDNGGVPPGGIEEFFRECGYHAVLKTAESVQEIQYEVSKGTPVIMFIHGEEPYTSVHNTHYVPLVGYDEEYVYLADSVALYANCRNEEGLPYNRKETWEKLERLWTNVEGIWDYPYIVVEK